MSDNNIINISDASQPNAGRVYDYLLGGNHNFEIDRIAGDNLIKITPFIQKIAKQIRWFLGLGVKRGIELGFTQFIDYASGLPTVKHIQQLAPSNAKIIYSDIDPITVQYGKKIIKEIGNNLSIIYEKCDIRTPENLFVYAEEFFSNHKVVIGFNGICYFLTNEEIQNSMKTLYDWADEGSILFFCDGDIEDIKDNKYFKTMMDAYENMNQPIYYRGKSTMSNLVKPWKIMDPGFLYLHEWYNIPSDVKQSVVEFSNGVNQGYYGGILIK